jgi:endonuclease/exonuclease/phosphatase family metal-dependent hydrolase
LSDTPTTLIIGVDFNCVLEKTDATGHFNYSRALNTLISDYDLVHMWASATGRGVYTHYTRAGAARLDRIYVTRQISGRKYGIETAVAAFTDHLEVILRISLEVTTVQRGCSYWKMDEALLSDVGIQKILNRDGRDGKNRETCSLT